MDYKKIIKSRSVRLKILDFLSFIPDKPMLKIQYRMKTGRKLNLKKPQRFTEKLQWYKLYYKNPKMIQCVDKYDVRDYVKSKGLEEILIPCYGVYNSADEIDWDSLPNQFVMKDTLGGGGASVVIVTDKKKEDIEKLKVKCREWTSIDAHAKGGGREWPYYSGKNHRIIIEKYIDSNKDAGGLIDYKFFCFDGSIAYLYVTADREVGNDAGVGIYDSDFRRTEVQRLDKRPLKRFIEKPENYEELKKVAEVLSDRYPEVRIDLYDIDGEIRFGELTFYDGSGYMKFDPDKFDFKLGECFKIPQRGLRSRQRIVIRRSEEVSNGNAEDDIKTESADQGLIDYKILCFNGKAACVYVLCDRKIGMGAQCGIFDVDFNLLPYTENDERPLTWNIRKPKNYSEMVELAEILSWDFSEARIDLYNIHGKILFGEITFYDSSGYMKFEPDSFDFELGEKWHI